VSAAAELAGIRLARDGTQILDGVDLMIAEREIVALVGPSGAGKSTLLRVLLGLDPCDAGVVRLGDRIATEGKRIVIPPEQRGIGVVFQELALWPHLTVHGNLAFGLSTLARADRDARIDTMLRRVSLVDKARRYPSELSGGERQRVAIARALVTEPRLVALDEPLASLDVALEHELLELFGALLRERGSAALYITHDPFEALVADRTVVIESGRIVQAGTLDELRSAPATPFVTQFIHRLASRAVMRAQ
jgi:iron(III) transport system ATP-binding protein